MQPLQSEIVDKSVSEPEPTATDFIDDKGKKLLDGLGITEPS
jgi:hypothetical protein